MRRLGPRAGGAEAGANVALEFRPALLGITYPCCCKASNGLARNSKLAKDHELIAPTHKRIESELCVVKLRHPKIRFTNLSCHPCFTQTEKLIKQKWRKETASTNDRKRGAMKNTIRVVSKYTERALHCLFHS